ncbi:MAG: hypothetical protein ACQESR_11325 [Planctomycetota bacterium]
MRSEPPLTQQAYEHIQTSRRETLDQLDHHHTTLDPGAPIADDLPTDRIEELQRIEERDLNSGK